MLIVYVEAGFIAGWIARSAIDRAMLAIFLRIFTSAIGKQKMLAMIAAGIEKMKRKP